MGSRGNAPRGVLEKHRRFSVANASHAKASQERKPQAKRDWMTLTAGAKPQLSHLGIKLHAVFFDKNSLIAFVFMGERLFLGAVDAPEHFLLVGDNDF